MEVSFYAKFPLTASTNASVKYFNECLREYLKNRDYDILEESNFLIHEESLSSAFGIDMSEFLENESQLAIGNEEAHGYVLIPLYNIAPLSELKIRGATELVTIVGDHAWADAIFFYQNKAVDIKIL